MKPVQKQIVDRVAAVSAVNAATSGTNPLRSNRRNPQLQQVLLEFKETYNPRWLIMDSYLGYSVTLRSGHVTTSTMFPAGYTMDAFGNLTQVTKPDPTTGVTAVPDFDRVCEAMC